MKKKLLSWMLIAALTLTCAGRLPAANVSAADDTASTETTATETTATETTATETTSTETTSTDDSSSEKYTGWKKKKKKKYYYKNGVMLKNRWIKVDGKKYHLSKSGALDVSKWVGKRYVDKTGAWVKGAIKGTWSGTSFRKSNGTYLTTGEYYINGYYYIFNNGTVQKNGWTLLNKVWYYCDSKGRVATSKWIKASFPNASTDSWWKTFESMMPYKWVNEKGQFDARQSKTVKWEETLIVKKASTVSDGYVREGWYYIEPKNKNKPAYYQWVKKSGYSTEDYREINKITSKVKVAFGVGETKNPWCIQLKNCKLTRIE